MSIRLIVGLGNPGRDYADTRHNAGFIVADAFAAAHRAEWKRRREFQAEVARVTIASGELHLLKPLTFMNASGTAVGAFCRFHKIVPAEVAVIYDELNIPCGRVKLSVSGSAGGHNGVASLLQHFGDGFARFRIGIGPRDPPAIDLQDYVLGKLTPEQQSLLHQNMPEFLAGLDLLLSQGTAAAMNRINRRPVSDDRSTNQEKL
jgi:PTH1 family peptidyl-tRNA hydrolase